MRGCRHIREIKRLYYIYGISIEIVCMYYNFTNCVICPLAAPCPPVLQVSTASCISDQVLVLWTWVQDALNVAINATSMLGQSVSCTSTNTSCTIQGLQCGQRYTVQGTSLGTWCNSSPSVPLSIVTGKVFTNKI